MAVVRVAVHAHSRVDDRRVGESRKCGCQKLVQISFVVGSAGAPWRFSRHFPPGTVVCDLHHAIAIDGETVITGRSNVCAENWKSFGCECLRLSRLEVKHWLAC